MTAPMIEVEWLTDEALEASPPCDCLLFDDSRCGKPAVARIRNLCSCGDRTFGFVCVECLHLLLANQMICDMCKSAFTRWAPA